MATKSRIRKDVWSVVNREDSLKEGWDLFNVDGILQIQKIDDPEGVKTDFGFKDEPHDFKDDSEAIRHVMDSALSGCIRSLLALYLSGHRVSTLVFIPRKLLGKCGGWYLI